MTVLVVTNDEAASQQADRAVRFRDGEDSRRRGESRSFRVTKV
jgi:ABC-type siderophore export system fused ATPase/permease subunit